MPQTQHRILLDSGFGRYLSDKVPKAIANDFLYYQPSLLLWTDELLCDRHGLEAESVWAKKGFVVSEISVELAKRKLLTGIDCSTYFTGGVNAYLKLASEEDRKESESKQVVQYATPELGHAYDYTDTSFQDLNCMLYLSSALHVPHLNTRPADNLYRWKFRRWLRGERHRDSTARTDVELQALAQILHVYVPSFEIFPKNDAFRRAEETKERLLAMTTAFCGGRVDASMLDRQYSTYLDTWLKYDEGVRVQALENLEVILEFRKDKRLQKLRHFLSDFANTIAAHPANEDFPREVALRFRMELLEAERDLIKESSMFSFLDKCTSHISFPVQAVSSVLGAAVSVLAQDPLFLAIGNAPGLVKWISDGASDVRKKAWAWHTYLLDFKERVGRASELRRLEEEIERLS